MRKEQQTRAKNAILGALVADAASVGFHWLYDQTRIRTIAPQNPEFHRQSEPDYANVAGFYAHGRKQVGDSSHYGEHAQVMLRVLAANQCRYDKSHYEDAFCAHFGYGGDYIGYVDHPMRAMMHNIATANIQALQAANAAPVDADERSRQQIIDVVLPLVRNIKERTALQQAVEEQLEDASKHADALLIADALHVLNDYHGANDTQLTALTNLPALVAGYVDDERLATVIASAVRVTNHNDQAVAYAVAAAHMLQASIQGSALKTVLTAGRIDPDITELMDEALDLTDLDTATVTADFGMSCELEYGLPSVVHNIATSTSYRASICNNIYAGGDSCGRAILLGAVLGAHYGVGTDTGIPTQWIDALTHKDEVMQLMQGLF